MMKRGHCRALLVSVSVLIGPTAFALITSQSGNTPLEDPRLPQGALAVANLPYRTGHWIGPPFGGGQYNFEYVCEDIQQFNDALKLFAAIEAPELNLVIAGGDGTSPIFREDGPKDFSFMVWIKESFDFQLGLDHLSRRARWDYFNNGNPRLTVFIRPDGVIKWHDVPVPENLVVTDQRVVKAPVNDKSGSAIKGIVLGSASHSPIGGAQAVLVDAGEDWKDRTRVAEKTTDDSGFFLFEGIHPGNYYVNVLKEGFSASSENFSAPEWKKYQEFTFDLSPAGSVSGTVVDVEGNLLPGVEVRVGHVLDKEGMMYPLTGIQPDITSEEGQFIISGLPEGKARINCVMERMYLPGSLRVHDVPSENIRLTMVKVGALRGKVLTKDGNPPSDPVHVFIQGEKDGDPIGRWGGSMLCNEDGTFSFEEIPPDTYRVNAGMPVGMSRDGLQKGEICTVESEKTANVELVLDDELRSRRFRHPQETKDP